MLLTLTSILLLPYAITTTRAVPHFYTSLGSYDMPCIRDPNYGYLANISIGSPPQQITSFVDWTWTSQYVVSTTCAGNDPNAADCYSPNQVKYSKTMSTTYLDESKKYPSESWYPNEFLPAPFDVDYASDVETIGPVSRRVVIQTSDFQKGYFTSLVLPFAGFFGMMPSFPGSNASDQSPFYQQYLAGAWPAPYSAFVLCSDTPSCPRGIDGIQTLGGYNKALASKGLTWYPVVPVPLVNVLDIKFSPGIFSYWSIALTGLSIGGQKQALNTTMAGGPAAIIDHASRGRGLPLSTAAYANLVKTTKATLVTNATILASPPNNGGGEFYSVDCATVSKLPCITYTFGGSDEEWKVEPSAYVINEGSICVLNVRTIGNGDFQYGNFGENFLKGKYIVFDFESRRVGLAKL